MAAAEDEDQAVQRQDDSREQSGALARRFWSFPRTKVETRVLRAK